MTSLNTSKLRQALETHARISDEKLHKRHPRASTWWNIRGIKPAHVRHHVTRLATAGALAGAMLMSNPLLTKVLSAPIQNVAGLPQDEQIKLFAANIKQLVPETVRPLTGEEDEAITGLIEIFWGLHASSTLEGEHLNTSYGYIGQEQHLPRYPGDSLPEHNEYQDKGITPGKGAWGYFANSKNEMTPDLVAKEKYYVAVQTLYLPDWQTRLAYLRDWYKYRKVVVINPANGKAIIADIADAGPSLSTGKQFGGSPEVMAYLQMHDGSQKGTVLMLFVDDKENKIPLGPLTKRTKEE